MKWINIKDQLPNENGGVLIVICKICNHLHLVNAYKYNNTTQTMDYFTMWHSEDGKEWKVVSIDFEYWINLEIPILWKQLEDEDKE